MSQGNKLKFQRGAAANTEFEDRNQCAENVTMTVTVWPARENLQSFSALWSFEHGQGRGAKARKAAHSHTGALIGDFATAGAIVAYTMDEMMDLVPILVRYSVLGGVLQAPASCSRN